MPKAVGRTMLRYSVFVALVGCGAPPKAHVEPAEPPVAEPATSVSSADSPSETVPPPPFGVCPTPDLELDLRSCADLPERYGREAEHPLEWGLGARGELFFGRLMCANGAQPRAKRSFSLGEAPTASTAPSSGLSLIGDANILDSWSVTCPGEATQTWYASLYRCGSPCPPTGMGLVGASAFTAYQETSRLMKDVEKAAREDVPGLLAETLRHAEAATAAEPTSALLRKRLAFALLWNQRYQEAEQAFQQVLRVEPDEWYAAINVGIARQQREDYALALEQYDALLSVLPSDHALQSESHCRRALVLQQLGRLAEAGEGAARACAAGTWCCKLRDELQAQPPDGKAAESL